MPSSNRTPGAHSREVVITNHLTDRATSMAIRVDQILTQVDRAVSQGNIKIDDEARCRKRISAALDHLEEELLQVRKVSRSRQRTRGSRPQRSPGNRNGSNGAEAVKTADAEGKTPPAKKQASPEQSTPKKAAPKKKGAPKQDKKTEAAAS